jgi:thioredoxin 2
MAGRVKLVKVNVDEAPKLQQRFGVRAVPTLMVLRDGRVLAERAGAVPAAEIRAWAEQAIAGQPQTQAGQAQTRGGVP